MRTNGTKLACLIALLAVISGSGLAAATHRDVTPCDGITCATPPVKRARTDSTKTKSKPKKSDKKTQRKTTTQQKTTTITK